jgi:hypothetical protein
MTTDHSVDPTSQQPQFTVVSRSHHAGKKWQRLKSYRFASTVALATIVDAELVNAALAMPVAFVKNEDRFVLVAVLSLTPGRNMLVAPDGRWLGAYVPANFRAYPFCLLPKQGTNEMMLCVHANSDLVVEGDSAGEDFLDKDGNISPALKQLVDLLNELERRRRVTEVALAALAEAGVFCPWSIMHKTGEGEQAIAGLHRIDEAALNALPDEAFLKVRKSAALPIAYAQLLSMYQIGIFEPLARLHAKLTPPAASIAAALPENIDSLFKMPDDDLIRFR